MARFQCAVPFKAGETWCRRNFFSLDLKPIGDHPQVIAVAAPDLPEVVESAATRTSVVSEMGDETTVIEVYLRLAAPAAASGTAVATVEADLEGSLLACGEVADACPAGSSG